MLRRALLLAIIFASPAFAQARGPQGPESGRMREQEWRIPAAGGSPLMVATVFRPPGDGRAPLVVINHGSPESAAERTAMERPRYSAISAFFLARGYVVVLPLRPGYGRTRGRWLEAYGDCERPDYVAAGLRTATDIEATVDYMSAQSFVAPGRTIIVGQSAGGWGTLALSSLNPPGVPAMIDFAGGRGGHQTESDGVCRPDLLVGAARRFGATARVPLLWMTTANDSFFGPALVRRMVDAYRGAGGQTTHRTLGTFGRDGHDLAENPAGAGIWEPLISDFLKGK
jgi:dienelactone hydrolase